MNNENDSEIIRLPIWRACLENMLEEGIDHGKTWSSEYFEKALKCNRDSMQYGLAISEIRRELERLGYYITGRGQNGAQLVVVAAEQNADVMEHYQRVARDCMKRGVILGGTTRTKLLTVEQRRRHEGLLEKMQTRLALISRKSLISNQKQIERTK